MIHPYITYGILAWGNARKSEVNRTYLLQKRAMRIINKSSYNSHTNPLFKVFNSKIRGPIYISGNIIYA